MAKSKAKVGELVVVDQVGSGNLQIDTSVKFEGKITNSDLMNALIFEIEEDLLNSQKKIKKELGKNNAEWAENNVKSSEALVAIASKHSSKEVDSFTKALESFTGKKAKAIYTAFVSNKLVGKKQVNVLYIRTTINYNNADHYGSKQFTKDEEQKTIPSAIKKFISNGDKFQKKQTDLNDEHYALQEQINELPRLKKRLQAKFVKTMLNGNVNDRKIMFAELKAELLKHCKESKEE